jgi:hypothetical protein
MTYRALFHMTAMYASVAEALEADTWMTTWRAQNYANVRPAGSSQLAAALLTPNSDDPGDPTAYGVFTADLHLEAADSMAGQALSDQITSATMTGSPLTAIQSSQQTMTAE